MPYAQRPFTCVDCGDPVIRRKAKGSQVRCTGCAIEYAAEAARQLHAHEGPIFERWLLGNAAGAGRSIAYSEFMLLGQGPAGGPDG